MQHSKQWIGAGILTLAILLAMPVQAGSCQSNKPMPTMAGADLVDTAVGAGSFNTLVAAVQAAGLVDALKGDGPLTVFAPNDEAFAKLPHGTIETLLRPENKDMLVSILTYHVAPGRLTAEKVVSMDRIKTLNGQRPAISASNDGVEIDNARIIKTDIEATNGVIHVIDEVILPDTMNTKSSPAEELIRLAINRGAPLYNDNQPRACAAIYEVAARSLLDSEAYGLDRHERSTLEHALADMTRTHDARRQAWIMRDALDEVIASLRQDNMPGMSMAQSRR